ncbi:MAG: aminoacyl-tRNA hydrolase [Mycoplasmataceae bacterium]|jgi:PTH1 family peptidyl-tRNA hydrolase|nr:aminoacyl-tRNA hydrolase [Mycoplasmataceae bacterium]
MKLIIGLGNYPLEYTNTRHNAGFMAIDSYCNTNRIVFDKDEFNGHFTIINNSFIFAKPFTLMNLSGGFVKKMVDFYKINIDDILIICDDVHLNVGHLRVRKEGGAGGHNGLKDINLQLGTENYKRLRIGVGPHLKTMDLAVFVLQKLNQAELSITKALIDDKVIKIINDFISDVPFSSIMSKYNTK